MTTHHVDLSNGLVNLQGAAAAYGDHEIIPLTYPSVGRLIRLQLPAGRWFIRGPVQHSFTLHNPTEVCLVSSGTALVTVSEGGFRSKVGPAAV